MILIIAAVVVLCLISIGIGVYMYTRNDGTYTPFKDHDAMKMADIFSSIPRKTRTTGRLTTALEANIPGIVFTPLITTSKSEGALMPGTVQYIVRDDQTVSGIVLHTDTRKLTVMSDPPDIPPTM